MEVIRIKYSKDDIIKQSNEVDVCFKCSACATFCPATMYVKKYNITDAFISQLFGAEEDEALTDVWMCCNCEKCIMVCPQDAEPAEVFNNLKRLSYEKGRAPPGVYSLIKQVLNTGMVYDVSAKVNADRKKINLKELTMNEAIANDLKKIAENTGLKVKEDS
jgi:heterodisulfide reductase subunit C